MSPLTIVRRRQPHVPLDTKSCYQWKNEGLDPVWVKGNSLASSSINRLAEELGPGNASNVFVFALPQ